MAQHIQDIQSGGKMKESFHCRLQTTNMKILKQSVGIDVSQNELAVSLGRLNEELTSEIYSYKTFNNTAKGFEELVNWTKKLVVAEVAVYYVMEATGIYHEALAYYLADNGQLITVLTPNKTANYQRTLQIKTVTDKTSSQVIAMFGLERKLQAWQKPKQTYRDIRLLTRERGQLVEEKTVIKNQLHAEQSQAFPNKKSIERMQARIKLLDNQQEEIMQEIRESVKQDKCATEAIKIICTIPGIGLLTAATILGETNGFELITNKRQLASYAGLDIKEKQSGTSVNGKPRISKKGNKYLRKAMHLPALSAIRHDERYKAIFARLVQKHGIKMKAAVAVQRRLLEMTYIIYKTNKPYDKDYLKIQIDNKNVA